MDKSNFPSEPKTKRSCYAYRRASPDSGGGRLWKDESYYHTGRLSAVSGRSSGSVLASHLPQASKEMRERAMSILQGNGYKTPLISTFHSLCLNILRREIDKLGYRQDFTIFDSSDQHSLLRISCPIKFEDKSFKPDISWKESAMTKNEWPAPDRKNCVPPMISRSFRRWSIRNTRSDEDP